MWTRTGAASLLLAGLAATAAAGQAELQAGGGPLVTDSGWNASGSIGVRLPLVTPFVEVEQRRVEAFGRTTSLLGGVRIAAFPSLVLSPHVLGAYGRGWFRETDGTGTDSGSTLHLGFGLRVSVSSSVALFSDVRFTVTENELADGADIEVPLKFGLVWRPSRVGPGPADPRP